MSSCPDCRRHIDEVNRLRKIIADQDALILAMKQDRDETYAAVTAQMNRIHDSLHLFNGHNQ